MFIGMGPFKLKGNSKRETGQIFAGSGQLLCSLDVHQGVCIRDNTIKSVSLLQPRCSTEALPCATFITLDAWLKKRPQERTEMSAFKFQRK